jgi:hypothetical protein
MGVGCPSGRLKCSERSTGGGTAGGGVGIGRGIAALGGVAVRGGGTNTSGGRRIVTEASGFGLTGSLFVVLARKLTIIKCTISENRTA